MYNPSAGQVGAPPMMMGLPAAGNQQYYPHQPHHGPQPWSSGLCDCCDDCGNCCMTCFCPCVTFGRIAEIVDGGSSSCGASGALYALLANFTCCHWIYSCSYRSKLRAQYSLAKAPCGDCCVHLCCETCALCQEYRELKNKGFDMTIGWQGNMEKRARMAMANIPPPMQGAMYR